MGDIFKKVEVCSVTAQGKKTGCAIVDALVDTGATRTVISKELAKRIGGQLLPERSYHGTIEGRLVPLKLLALHMPAPGCTPDVIAAIVDDRAAGRAGKAPSGEPAQMILGHDYLQRKFARIDYKEDGHKVSCKKR